jgi:hypothetical protein
MQAVEDSAAALSPAAARYREFVHAVLAGGGASEGLAEGRGPGRRAGAGLPDETELQSLWFAGEFGRRFTTTAGEPVVVVEFGSWNRSAGPDFTDTVVEVAGERRRGAVEIDLDARGWESHAHATNPAYDDVVLHVFVRPAAGGTFFTKTSQNREVPQVQLDPDGASPPEPWHLDRVPEARLGRCSVPLRGMEAGRVESLLHAAARYRLERKAGRVARVAALHGWEQALFQGVAEALGYRRNKLAMRVLAQRLPLAVLRAARGDAEAILFGAAGFLESPVYETAAPDTREYLRGLWETWWKRRSEFAAPDPSRTPNWVTSGTRPVNHPQRRVAALAGVAGNWRRLAELAGPERPPDARGLTAFFEGLRHDYWSYHFTMSSGRSGRAMALVGQSRATDVIANWVVPLHLACASDAAAAWETFLALPARLDNEKSRRAALRLLGDHPDHKSLTSRVAHQQGLLQVYEDFCLEDDSGCAGCPFPEQLGQWTGEGGEGVRGKG